MRSKSYRTHALWNWYASIYFFLLRRECVLFNLHMLWNGFSLMQNRSTVKALTMHLSVDNECNPNKSIELIYFISSAYLLHAIQLFPQIACWNANDFFCVENVDIDVSFKLAMPIRHEIDFLRGCIISMDCITVKSLLIRTLHVCDAPIWVSMLKIAF